MTIHPLVTIHPFIENSPDADANLFGTDDGGAKLQYYYALANADYHALAKPASVAPERQSGTSDNSQGLFSPVTTAPSTAPTSGTYVDAFGNAPAESLGFAAPSHGGGGGGSGGGGGTPAPWTYSSGNLTFDINWDSSVGKAPSGFVGAFETAVKDLIVLNSPLPDTITLDVGWGETGGSMLPFGALGESATNIFQVNYAALQTAMNTYLVANNDSPLPSTNPEPNNTLWVAGAEEKALGLIPNNTSLDSSVGFSSRVSWNFTTSTTIGYDFISIAEHEISEAMGRLSLIGATISDNGTLYTNGLSPMDLFRYSAPGTRSVTSGQAAYFSPNGGASSGPVDNLTGSSLTYFNSTAGGDPGDWQSSGATSAGRDAYSAFASSGVQYAVSNVDQTLMNVLGFHG